MSHVIVTDNSAQNENQLLFIDPHFLHKPCDVYSSVNHKRITSQVNREQTLSSSQNVYSFRSLVKPYYIKGELLL